MTFIPWVITAICAIGFISMCKVANDLSRNAIEAEHDAKKYKESCENHIKYNKGLIVKIAQIKQVLKDD